MEKETKLKAMHSNTNSIPAIDKLSRQASRQYQDFTAFHVVIVICSVTSKSSEWDQNLMIKNTGEKDTDLICKQMHIKIMQMHMKNNAILCKLWGCWWKLHLCFDQLTKYNPDVVLIKMRFSQLFAQNVGFYAIYLHSSVNKIKKQWS